jgi:ABC-type transport system involved in multi-copper enzyme maturation permease subunit
MSAHVQPSRSGELRAALRAEWTKFRTVRGWMIGSVFAALMVVLFTFLQANGKHTGYCTTPNPNSCVAGHQYVPTGPSGEAVADTYELVAKRLTGDGTITARITSLAGRVWAGPANEAPSLADTRPGLTRWAKAGLLITPSTSQGSSYAAVMATGGHGVRFQYDYTHDQAGLPGPISGAAARWLRLTRAGDTITGYDSADGTHWTRVGTARLAGLSATVQAGLFATSPGHSTVVSQSLASGTGAGAPTLATGVFDHASLSGTSPGGTWTGDAVGGKATGGALSKGFQGFHQAGGRFTVGGSGDIAPLVPAASAGLPISTIEQSLVGAFAGLIAVVVVAVMFISAEYRRGMIRTTLAASPRRGRVLAAKAIVIGSVTFVVGLAAAVVGVTVGTRLSSDQGSYVLPVSSLTELRVIVGTAALLAAAAVLALAIGTMVRRSAAAVTAVIVAIVLPYILGVASVLPLGAADWLLRLTPAAAFAIQQSMPQYPQVAAPYTATAGYFPLAPWAGFAVLCGYAALALGLAVFLLHRRDA